MIKTLEAQMSVSLVSGRGVGPMQVARLPRHDLTQIMHRDAERACAAKIH
jgi:hypothetical protein